MKIVSKKEVKATVDQSLANIISQLEITSPSKKTSKLIEKMSKKLSGELKDELRKQFKKESKASKLKVSSKPQKQLANG